MKYYTSADQENYLNQICEIIYPLYTKRLLNFISDSGFSCVCVCEKQHKNV